MSIQEIPITFKRLATDERSILPVLIVVVGFCSFFLGRLSVTGSTLEIEDISQNKTIEVGEMSTQQAVVGNTLSEETVSEVGPGEITGGYVASKSGTKYHLPWCSGAQRIKEENKIWFATKEDAERAGYTPAANCPGI